MTKEEARLISEAEYKRLSQLIGYIPDTTKRDGRVLLLLKYLYDALHIYCNELTTSTAITTALSRETTDGGHTLNNHVYTLLFQ